MAFVILTCALVKGFRDLESRYGVTFLAFQLISFGISLCFISSYGINVNDLI